MLEVGDRKRLEETQIVAFGRQPARQLQKHKPK
jgi:hypothetical protein